MYKVFINNRPLFLADNAEKEVFSEGTLFVRCNTEEVFDTVFRLAHYQPVFFPKTYLIGKSAKGLFEIFKTRCKYIKAAGGRVKNAEGKTLLIFRSGKWDLPKGKIEKGEEPPEAAIREVEEECGISGLKIVRSLEPTYHTYIHKEKIVLKKTYWFEMSCSDTSKLIPQTEEGITEVKWADETELHEAMQNTFQSILDVVNQA